MQSSVLRRAPSALTLLSLAVLGACTPDIEGILAADRTGTLLEPAAPRVDALAEVREGCGATEEAGGSIARHPYLQSVSEGGATLTWTTEAERPEIVALRHEGEENERLVEPHEDSTIYLRDHRQLSATLGALEPSSLYCYELRDASGRRVFGPAGFRTAPRAEGGERIDLVVLGDSGGGGPDQRAVAAQMATVPIDLMLHVGDLAYDNGTLPQLETKHFEIYRPLMSIAPLFPAIGDHDEEVGGAGAYREVFTLPRNAGEAANERYYSFDWGPLHVLVLDAGHLDERQRQFADADLAGTDRPWKIVVVHTGPYSSGFHGSRGRVRRDYSPMFARHGVQLVFSGDDHDYERSVPIDGVTYVITGGGGRSVRPVGASEWTAFSVMAFHFVYVSIEDDRMRLHAVDGTGREFDGAEILRDAR